MSKIAIGAYYKYSILVTESAKMLAELPLELVLLLLSRASADVLQTVCAIDRRLAAAAKHVGRTPRLCNRIGSAARGFIVRLRLQRWGGFTDYTHELGPRVNLIASGPGCGKTRFCLGICAALAEPLLPLRRGRQWGWYIQEWAEHARITLDLDNAPAGMLRIECIVSRHTPCRRGPCQ